MHKTEPAAWGFRPTARETPTNAGNVVWLWQVSGGAQWSGVADTFGQAQQDAETCMGQGGKAAVVESALLVYNAESMQREYVRTGRRCTASRKRRRIRWTDFAPETADQSRR